MVGLNCKQSESEPADGQCESGADSASAITGGDFSNLAVKSHNSFANIRDVMYTS